MQSRTKQKRLDRGTRSLWHVGLPVAAVVLLLTAYGALILHRDVLVPVSVQLAGRTIDRADLHERTAEFISYNNSVTLTADQQRIMDEALSSIPSPCRS